MANMTLKKRPSHTRSIQYENRERQKPDRMMEDEMETGIGTVVHAEVTS